MTENTPQAVTPAAEPTGLITNTDDAVKRLMAAMEPPDTAAPTEQGTESTVQPTEDAAPEEASGDDAETDTATPSVAPPASWPAEDKAWFKTLPLKAQEIVANRERERDTAISKRLNEIADERKAVQAEREKAISESKQASETLPMLLHALRQKVMGTDLAKMTPADWTRLADDNPAAYVQKKAQHDELVHLFQQAQQIETQSQQRAREESDTRRNAYIQEQHKLLSDKLPAFVDEKTGPEMRAKATNYLREQGFADEELGNINDHRLIMVINDALRGRESDSKAKIAQTKVANVPPVAKPGAAKDTSQQRKAGLISALHRTNDTFEQAKILEQLL